MKNLLKIGMILIIMFSITLQFTSTVVYADGLVDDPSTYKPSDGDQGNDKLIDKGSKIASLVRNIGIAVAVIALMYIGIRAMTGSVEEKTEFKESIPGYLIGVVLVVAITTLPSLIETFSKGTFN